MSGSFLSKLVSLTGLALFSIGCYGQVSLPPLFSDNMVLQQRSKVAIWGNAAPGEQITVSGSWNGKMAKAMTGPNGRWQLRLATPAAGGPYRVIVAGGRDTLILQNVLLGEVWLCSGQSNMNFPLGKTGSWRTGVEDYEKVIAAADFPAIRMFTVEQQVADTPVKTLKGRWQVCSPATAGGFSAVAYYFARELTRVTGIPIGLLHSSVGGTPAEAWTRREVMASDIALATILDRFDKLVAAHPDSTKKYTAGSKSPARLYNGMIWPLVPFTIRGVIWYQGESNSDRPYQYRTLFTALIRSWRQDWKVELPFYFVQIAPFKDKPPELREAQFQVYRSLPRTGMVVITDAGDSLNIHPRNKEVVGRRLAGWALVHEYGQKDSIYSGPLYRSMLVEGNSIRISFDHTGDSLVAKGGEPLREFSIAGSDRRFVPANARINGRHLYVSSEQVPHPVAVRFAWKPFPRPNLFNSAGLPASPFRTDDWK